MLSNNSSSDKFNLLFTEDFFIDSICDKYNLMLKAKNYPLETIQDMIKESIQTVELPGFEYEPLSQTIIDGANATTSSLTVNKTSEQNLAEQKRITVNFRHSDGYLTYFCLLEHYFARYIMGVKNVNRKPFDSMVVSTYSRLNVPMCRLYFKKCLFVSMPQLVMSYSNVQRDFSEFSCGFTYNILETAIEIPDVKLK